MSAPDSRARALAELEALADNGELDALAEALAKLVAARYLARPDQTTTGAPDPPPENDSARPVGRAGRGS